MEEFDLNHPQMNRRRTIGKKIIYVGLFILVSMFTLELGVMLVDAYGDLSSLMNVTHDVAILTFPLSLILILFGLALILIPDGLTADYIWIFNVGPHNK